MTCEHLLVRTWKEAGLARVLSARIFGVSDYLSWFFLEWKESVRLGYALSLPVPRNTNVFLMQHSKWFGQGLRRSQHRRDLSLRPPAVRAVPGKRGRHLNMQGPWGSLARSVDHKAQDVVSKRTQRGWEEAWPQPFSSMHHNSWMLVKLQIPVTLPISIQ